MNTDNTQNPDGFVPGQQMTSKSEHPGFDALVRIIWQLRQPDGCPWDRAQTHTSIAKNMIEEAYEAVDAIEQGSSEDLAGELGDVLMQVVLQSQIAADEGAFTIDDVCQGIVDKLVRRHPHVFGDHAPANSAEDVLNIWDQVKLEEHRAKEARQASAAQAGAAQTGAAQTGAAVLNDGTSGNNEPGFVGLLDSVPTALPALMACQKISRKAVSAGFEWSSTEAVWEQVMSEIDEFHAARPGSAHAQMEFGDILFALVNVARREHIDAETALRASCGKFRRRWSYMEQAALSAGHDLASLSREEQEALWVEAKSKEMDQ